MTKITDTTNLRLGASAVDKAYVGSVQVYPAAPVAYAFPVSPVLSDFAGAATVDPPGFQNHIIARPILDAFNRANGAPGSNWATLIGTEAVPQINANKLLWSAGTHSFRWSPTTFGPGVEVYADVVGDNIAIWARVVAAPASGQPRTGYVTYVDASRTRVSLWKADGTGFTTQLAGSPVTGLPTIDAVKMACIGSWINVYTRTGTVWTHRIKVNDTSWAAAGYVGGELLSSGAAIDNFGAGSDIGSMSIGGTGDARLFNASDADMWWAASTLGPDCEAYVQVTTKPGSGNSIRLYGRVDLPGSAGPNGYIVKAREYAGTDEFEICKMTAGGDSILGATIPLEFNAGDWVGMSVVGNVVSAYHKPSAGVWRLVGCRIDTTYAATGYIGVGSSFSTFRLDNFGGGLISSPPAAKVPTNAVLDNFNRANGAPGSNWAIAKSTYPIPPIATNVLSWPQFPSALWNPTTFNADQEVFCQISAGIFPRLLLRWTNPNTGSENGISVQASNATPFYVEALDWTNGVSTSLGYLNGVIEASVTWLWARVVGNVVELYTSTNGTTWTLRQTWITARTPGSGKIGIYAPNNGTGPFGTIDNFGGGNV